MARTIDPIRKEKIKQARLQCKSGKEALLAGGLSETTAKHEVGRNPTLKDVDKEIREELRAKDITIEWLLNQYIETQKLCKSKKDYATLKATIDSIAKYVAQIPDKTQEVEEKPTQEDIEEIQGYLNRLRAYEISN